ncbi:hypothetical protein RAS1_31560 [Phycisphaerae bacterium RAS1]|nr:hypothetical protein RAS1_31560 [Phycisphaerae bacterium RAS1]
MMPLASVALLWAALHYAVDGLFSRSAITPPTLAASPLALLLAGVLVVVGVRVLSVAGATGGPGTSLAVAGAALGLWAASGGTIDDWLIGQNEKPVGQRGSAYLALLGDYVLLAAIGAAILGRAALPRRRDATAIVDRTRKPPNHAAAVLLAVVLALGLLLILTGPIAARTLRGQVYFATFVAVGLGALAVRKTMHLHDAAGFWLTPILVGVIGVAAAAIKPDLMIPAGYNHLNMLPAWGPVRPLPIELVSVGWVALGWATSGPAEPHTSRAN